MLRFLVENEDLLILEYPLTIKAKDLRLSLHILGGSLFPHFEGNLYF
jgi:hypothetical protein